MPGRKLVRREDKTTMPQSRKVALVSGGSRGLGAELVSGFLDRRYGVATLSRTKTPFITDMLRARRRGHFHEVDFPNNPDNSMPSLQRHSAAKAR